jgi:hypothetical protein
MLPDVDVMRETHPLMWPAAKRRELLQGSPTLTRLEAGGLQSVLYTLVLCIAHCLTCGSLMRYSRGVALQVAFERQTLKPVFRLIGYRLWV